ncbi:MAG: hypothetical protein ABFR31_04680 [Thermodesulfobacteriota bacterium]
MKNSRMDHICIAVKNLKQAQKVLGPVSGKPRPDVEYIDKSDKIKTDYRRNL